LIASRPFRPLPRTCVGPLGVGWLACRVLIGLGETNLVAEAQDLLVLLGESQSRGMIARHLASSLHRAVAPLARQLRLCRLSVPHGSRFEHQNVF
jgi:hypothetical protein